MMVDHHPDRRCPRRKCQGIPHQFWLSSRTLTRQTGWHLKIPNGRAVTRGPEMVRVFQEQAGEDRAASRCAAPRIQLLAHASRQRGKPYGSRCPDGPSLITWATLARRASAPRPGVSGSASSAADASTRFHPARRARSSATPSSATPRWMIASISPPLVVLKCANRAARTATERR